MKVTQLVWTLIPMVSIHFYVLALMRYKCVCMPFWYHALSCSSSQQHSMDCDGIQSLQTCVQPCTVLLKQDFCWILVRANSSEIIPKFYQCPDVGVASWLSPISAMQPKESHLHSPRRQWSSPLPLMETKQIFLQDKLSMVPIHGLTFVANSKQRMQAPSAVTIPEKIDSPSASKCANNSE